MQYNSNTTATNLQAQSSYQQDNQNQHQDYNNATQSLPYIPTVNIGESQPYYSGNFYDPTQQQQQQQILTDTNVSTTDGYYQDNNLIGQQQQQQQQLNDQQQQYSTDQYGSYDHWNQQYQQSQTNDQVRSISCCLFYFHFFVCVYVFGYGKDTVLFKKLFFQKFIRF